MLDFGSTSVLNSRATDWKLLFIPFTKKSLIFESKKEKEEGKSPNQNPPNNAIFKAFTLIKELNIYCDL